VRLCSDAQRRISFDVRLEVNAQKRPPRQPRPCLAPLAASPPPPRSQLSAASDSGGRCVRRIYTNRETLTLPPQTLPASVAPPTVASLSCLLPRAATHPLPWCPPLPPLPVRALPKIWRPAPCTPYSPDRHPPQDPTTDTFLFEILVVGAFLFENPVEPPPSRSRRRPVLQYPVAPPSFPDPAAPLSLQDPAARAFVPKIRCGPTFSSFKIQRRPEVQAARPNLAASAQVPSIQQPGVLPQDPTVGTQASSS
jgi:hypothetical protein